MYKITTMKMNDIPQALNIWHQQFDKYCKSDSFPDFWTTGKETVKQYLVQQIDRGNAIVALNDTSIAGYMAWMNFDFHGEKTSFLPIVGNAAIAENENAIFHAMYLSASEKWVRDNRFNHLWMTYYDDIGLNERLYDLGFGSLVIDACRKTETQIVTSTSTYKITKATQDEVSEVLAMENESEENLLKSPVFLNRQQWKRDEIIKFIDSDSVFIAWDNDRAIGMMSVNINQNHHIEHLTITNSAGSLCAYIRPEYRGKGVGTQILHRVCEYCYKNGKPFLHVSFESANPDGIRFWPKHFRPIIRSVRRTVNKDANIAL